MESQPSVFALNRLHFFFSGAVRFSRRHLDDYHPGPLDDGPVPQICGAEIEAAVLVYRTGFQNDHVHRFDKAPVVIRHFAQIERHVVAAAEIMFFSVVA